VRVFSEGVSRESFPPFGRWAPALTVNFVGAGAGVQTVKRESRGKMQEEAISLIDDAEKNRYVGKKN